MITRKKKASGLLTHVATIYGRFYDMKKAIKLGFGIR